MGETDILFRPATELARAIREKQLSPVELTDAVLDHIAALQPRLNAFITVTAEAAREAAREAERAVAKGDALGPLHGIPFSVKDLTFTEGVRTTMGSHIHADFVPTEDAVPVARLKRAGAILVGKTTTPEYGHKPMTEAPLFGRTLNPWNPDFTCGGSSGGSAVAVAAGMGPLALGTDGGGSVRIPASCCGIVGLKATLGAVPHIHAPDLFGNNSYIGPMSRTVADARLMFGVIAGPDGGDPYALAPPPKMPALPQSNLEGVRIGWLPRAGNRHIDAEVLAAAEKTARLLTDMGAAVETVAFDFAAEEDLFLVLMQSALKARLGKYVDQFEGRLGETLVRSIEAGAAWTAADLYDAAIRRAELFHRVQDAFAEQDFIVSPTLSAPPVPADQDVFANIVVDGAEVGPIRGAWYPYTYPFNLTGHPALTLPCGFTGAGLPIGFQIVGPWHAEARILELADRIEAARPWADRRPPV